jgi:DNA-binding response OmpR family regulator
VAEAQDGRRMIAVIENDPLLSDQISNALQPYEHWQARFFAEGLVARDQVPAIGADVIVLDTNLPDLDGPSLYKILRGHSKTRSIPMIVITGSHDWELHRMGVREGLVLCKPFDMQELIDIIRALLPET